MGFTSKRGRPKSDRPARDLGTPELAYKRAHGLTEEPLDACLTRDLITNAQHWSGMHYRWLYTLRYGTADPTAIRWDTERLGISCAQDDPLWREAREAELLEASELLRANALFQPVSDLCIYNRHPLFLSRERCQRAFEQHDTTLAATLTHALEELQAGLKLLALHWKRK